MTNVTLHSLKEKLKMLKQAEAVMAGEIVGSRDYSQFEHIRMTLLRDIEYASKLLHLKSEELKNLKDEA